MSDMKAARTRLQSLPDTYRLTPEDLSIVQACFSSETPISYTTRDSQFFGFVVHEERVLTARDLRLLAEKHPRPKETRLKGALSFPELFWTLQHSVATTYARTTVLRDLLIEKKIITPDEWVQKFETVRNRDFWALADTVRLSEETFKEKWKDWIDDGKRTYAQFREISPIPDPPPDLIEEVDPDED